MEETSQPFDLRNLLWGLRRHAWVIALPPIAALCVASVYYKTAPVVYQSYVTVSIGDQANVGPALQPMVNADRDRGNARERINLVNSRIRSQAFLAEAAVRLGIMKSAGIQSAASAAARRYPNVPRAEFATRLASASVGRRIGVAPGEANLVRITATSESAEDAQSLAVTITDLLIEESRRSNLEKVMARGQFSQDQLIVYQERLRASENELQSFQESTLRQAMTRSPISEATAGQAHAVVRTTDLEMEQTRDRIESTKSLWNQYESGNAPPTLRSGNATELERRLAAAEGNLALASLDAAANAQEIPVLQGAVSSTRLALLREYEGLAAALLGDRPEPARDAAAGLATDRAILRTLKSKRERMAGYIGQFERGVETLPRKQLELTRLQGEVAANRELLNALQREAQSSRISEAFATSAMGLKVTIVEPPQLPLAPISPDPLRIFGSALLLGPLLSVGVVLAIEKLAIVIRTVDQAEKELQMRVLGTVPRIDGWDPQESFVARRWAALSIVLVLVLTGIFHGVRATSHSGPPQGNEAAPTEP